MALAWSGENNLRDIFLSLSKQDHEIKAFKVDGDECTTTKPHWARQRGDW